MCVRDCTIRCFVVRVLSCFSRQGSRSNVVVSHIGFGSQCIKSSHYPTWLLSRGLGGVARREGETRAKEARLDAARAVIRVGPVAVGPGDRLAPPSVEPRELRFDPTLCASSRRESLADEIISICLGSQPTLTLYFFPQWPTPGTGS